MSKATQVLDFSYQDIAGGRRGTQLFQAITVAAPNAATVLKINDHLGTIEPIKTADYIILFATPANDIKKHAEDRSSL